MHLSSCITLLAWGSCCGAESQEECHATPACVISSAVGRDSGHKLGEAQEEHTSVAGPGSGEQSNSCLNGTDGRRATRLLSSKEGDCWRQVPSAVTVQPLRSYPVVLAMGLSLQLGMIQSV